MTRLRIALTALAFALSLATSASPSQAQTVLAQVDIATQTMDVFVDGRRAYLWPVSTGRGGYRTPAGVFRPQRMYKRYFSRKYDNSPMPHAIFFHGGYAIHGTGDLKRLGRAASHGCVRLHPNNAAALYALVASRGRENTRIVITR